MIWFDKNISLSDLLTLDKGTMTEYLGVHWEEIGDDFIKAKMPVDHRTTQPYGVLHGGASCVLAETLGSVASHLIVDSTQFQTFGIEINANHIRSAKSGFVHGISKPIHIGSSTHVWDIRINDDTGKLICISRLTVAVIRKRNL